MVVRAGATLPANALFSQACGYTQLSPRAWRVAFAGLPDQASVSSTSRAISHRMFVRPLASSDALGTLVTLSGHALHTA